MSRYVYVVEYRHSTGDWHRFGDLHDTLAAAQGGLPLGDWICRIVRYRRDRIVAGVGARRGK